MTEVEKGLKASEFHLSWNNYEASLASFLRVLSSAKEGEEALFDVTISCSGGRMFQVGHTLYLQQQIILSLQAHRLVLATCSTYFRSLFVGRGSAGCAGAWSGCGGGHPIVFIPDLSDAVMEHLLAFMYRGETTVRPELLLPLIDAAKLLGIQGLMDPGNIRQLLEQNGVNSDKENTELNTAPKSVNSEETKMNGSTVISNGKSETVDEIITQELKENVDTRPQVQERPAPDSSNNSAVFPRVPVSGAPMFPLPSPLALSLATSQLALGLDLSQHLPFPPPHKRRRSDTAAQPLAQNTVSPTSSGASSNLINSSSGNGTAFAHYPPTEDPSRPFGCSQCPKRFRMKHHLKEHMLIHSGEMPFSCHLCPKRFNRSYTLKNHMKLHSAGAIVDKFQHACT